MIVFVAGKWRHDGATPHYCLYKELFLGVAVVVILDDGTKIRIPDVVEAPDVECRMTPGALGDHFGNATASLDKDDVPGT